MSQQCALAELVVTLRRATGYTLPPELDRRQLDLSERKNELTQDEQAELLAWVEFTQQSATDKLAAEVAIQRLVTAFSELADAV